jgi:hypothetical protein
MLSTSKEILSFRTLALLPVVLFMPSLVSFAVAPGTVKVEYTGILFHLAMMFLVSRMPAPDWGKGAGYAWLTLDVLCGVMMISHVPHDIAWPIRLAGHVFAGTWMITTSLLSRHKSVAILGTLTGAALALYTFFSQVLSTAFLYPGGTLLIAWLILMAVKYKSTPTDEEPLPEQAGQPLGVS